jgi:immune inhibitor A
MKKTLLFLSGLLLLLCCAAVVVGALFVGVPYYIRAVATSTASPVAVVTEPNAQTRVMPLVAATSTPPNSNSTLDELVNLNVPRNDPVQITSRLKTGSVALETPTAPYAYKVGDKAAFWVSRDITGTNELITATLRYATPHSYMWLEEGESSGDAGLKQSGDAFENNVYPTDREYLGGESTLGVDNDPHIFILNTHFTGSVAGYISQVDMYPRSVNPISNEHKLIYMNLRTDRPGSQYYTSVLAHEFAHLIHEHQNPREGSWITEGLGDLAMKLNGFSQDASSFVQDPDVQLNAWANQPGLMIPHYLAAYLFLSYSLNRFGPGFIRDIVSSETHDIATIQNALNNYAPGLKFDDLFADWVVANYIQDQADAPRYSYLDRSLGIRPEAEVSQYPTQQQGTVHQYAADYIQLDPAGHDVTFSFSGQTQVQAIPTKPHSGRMMWWGDRVDNSDTTLSREFDLTSVDHATLDFWTWYDIESNFDYGYVEASTDGGKHWDTLQATTTTTDNPNGSNYGNGFTCKSGAGCDQNAPPPQWLQEKVDLTHYAGKKAMIRFEYITDGIYVGAGFAIDDISIPEINFSDDAEQGDNGWQAQGFARIDNMLTQRFILQAIQLGATPESTLVVPIALTNSNHGTFTTSGLGKSVSNVIIVVSADTPVTWETASYSYSVQ